MLTTKFSKSWNGKLFPDFFDTIRLSDTDKYFLGAEHDIVLEGVNMGTAEIMGIRTLPFNAIRDVQSFLSAGLPAAKFCGFLKNTYNGDVNGGVQPDTEFQQITYRWKQRNYPAHQGYIASFMEDKLREYREALGN